MPRGRGPGGPPNAGPYRGPPAPSSPPPPPTSPRAHASPASARQDPHRRGLRPAAPVRRLPDGLGVRGGVERHAGLPGRPLTGLSVPGGPGARRGVQRHPRKGALARVGAASSGPAADSPAHSQPRRQQGHPASPGLVPAPGLPQPLCPPRHVPLPSAGEYLRPGSLDISLRRSTHQLTIVCFLM